MLYRRSFTHVCMRGTLGIISFVGVKSLSFLSHFPLIHSLGIHFYQVIFQFSTTLLVAHPGDGFLLSRFLSLEGFFLAPPPCLDFTRSLAAAIPPDTMAVAVRSPL